MPRNGRDDQRVEGETKKIDGSGVKKESSTRARP